MVEAGWRQGTGSPSPLLYQVIWLAYMSIVYIACPAPVKWTCVKAVAEWRRKKTVIIKKSERVRPMSKSGSEPSTNIRTS